MHLLAIGARHRHVSVVDENALQPQLSQLSAAICVLARGGALDPKIQQLAIHRHHSAERKAQTDEGFERAFVAWIDDNNFVRHF